MKAEIIIATYNAENRIGRTLDSLSRMAQHTALEEGDWRIVVVNNNSSDRTREVVESYKDKLPLEILDCPAPGKSKAQNMAVERIKADLVIFSDDDVEVAPDWMDKIVACAHQCRDFDVFSGFIKGHWEEELDPDFRSWIPVGSTYALHDEDMVSGPCDPGKVWGPNMALRRSVFDAGLRFDERIGPTPEKLYAMGGETDLARRAAAKGFKSYFIAEAVVNHLVKKETVNEEWIVKRAERLGYGIFVDGKDNYPRKMPDFVPVFLEVLFFFCFWACLYPLTFLMRRSKRKFWSRWKFYYYRGLIKGYQEFL
ncbi:MAG: glycosyltransferase family 2 protein [Alphaproteobacteria bacterium]|nr:glycosyltransferase family 2 protein [Alphaproteobacteria bacterium]